jgi:glycosyltransferase involved in cell wall biosynthesis
MGTQKSISIIIPVYNEQENIGNVYTQVTNILQSLRTQYVYQIIFVNDGSRDASWSLLVKLAEIDPCVLAINLSRNFGHQAALTAGYMHAQGDAVITMDADLQDTPELLLDMLRAWERGFAVVYARRIDRTDTFLKRWMAYIYYALLDMVAEVRIPRNVGDFRLLDKKVVMHINQMPERARYLRGMVAWVGFSYTYVDFKRPDRVAGVTGYTWKKMFKLGFDGFTAFSTFPLTISLYSGIGMSFCAVGLMAYMLFCTMQGITFGFTDWIMPFVILCIAIQSYALWLHGEYIGRIYDQQKGRPLYIIDQIVEHKVLQTSYAHSTRTTHKEVM